MNRTILHLAFSKFELFAEHKVTITVSDFTPTFNKTTNETSTVVVNSTLAVLSGDATPEDVMVGFNTTGNVTSRQVVVEFCSMYDGKTQTAQVAAGFSISYEYVDSGG